MQRTRCARLRSCSATTSTSWRSCCTRRSCSRNRSTRLPDAFARHAQRLRARAGRENRCRAALCAASGEDEAAPVHARGCPHGKDARSRDAPTRRTQRSARLRSSSANCSSRAPCRSRTSSGATCSLRAASCLSSSSTPSAHEQGSSTPQRGHRQELLCLARTSCAHKLARWRST